MKGRIFGSLFTVLTAFAVAGCDSSESSRESLQHALGQEIVRLEASLERLERQPPAGVERLLPTHRASLARASRAAVPELRLYRLRDAAVGIETLSFLAENSAAGASVEALEQLWKSQQSRFGEMKPHESKSALHRALADSARQKAAVLFGASLPYGRTSDAGSGLYYLAEASGYRRFADFVEGLPEPHSTEAAADRQALRSRLDALEKATLVAFEKEPSGRTTIPVSVRLKESRELLDRGSFDGAALALLEARMGLARAGGSFQPAAVKGQAPRGGLHRLFAEIAADEPGAASQAIVSSVLPLHDSLFSSGEIAAAGLVPITVTLVRWPYT
jgi:hypothetical protein